MDTSGPSVVDVNIAGSGGAPVPVQDAGTATNDAPVLDAPVVADTVIANNDIAQTVDSPTVDRPGAEPDVAPPMPDGGASGGRVVTTTLQNGDFIEFPECAKTCTAVWTTTRPPCASTCMTLQGPYLPYGPDSLEQPGVPKGTVTPPASLNSTILGKTRMYWVYVPANYDANYAHPLMVFPDGDEFRISADVNNPSLSGGFGWYRTPVVMDNLIAQKKLPPMIVVWIERPSTQTSERSVEYDTANDTWPRFIVEEVIPTLKKSYNITDNPEGRGIGGQSSGAIAAFRTVWFKTDHFRRVYNSAATFRGLQNPGADEFPQMVIDQPKKPIRMFLLTGTHDQMHDSCVIMAAALKQKGYDYRFVNGVEGHSPNKHAGSTFPQALQWLWAGYPIP